MHHHVPPLCRRLERLPASLRLHDPSPARYHAALLPLLQHPPQQRRLQLPELGPPVGMHVVDDGHPELRHCHIIHVHELSLRPPRQLLAHRRLPRPSHPDEDAVRVRGPPVLQLRVRVGALELGMQLEPEVVPELGVRLLHTLLLCDDEAGEEAAEDAERHGDSVIVMADDRSSSQPLHSSCPLDLDPIAQLPAHDPALAQLLHHHQDSVALLHPLVCHSSNPRRPLGNCR
eukprot:752659-Hanusia_phi.AAC.1